MQLKKKFTGLLWISLEHVHICNYFSNDNTKERFLLIMLAKRRKTPRLSFLLYKENDYIFYEKTVYSPFSYAEIVGYHSGYER